MSENLENRISSGQAKDAIVKMHSIQSSASEIDGLNDALSNFPDQLLNIYDLQKNAVGLDLVLPNPYPEKANTPVHPSVVYKKDYWNGYKYWIAYTPYPNSDSAFENPCVVATNDFINFDTPSSNPLVSKPSGTAYNADTHLFFEPDYSRLYLIFRERGVSGKNNLKIMHTEDGVIWTTPITLFSGDTGVEDFGSPSAWWNGAGFTFVYHNLDGGENKALYRVNSLTSDVYGEYSSPIQINIPPTSDSINRVWWHSCFVRNEYKQVIGIIQDSLKPGGGSGDLFLVESSDDGLNFTLSNTRVNSPNQKYRSAIFFKGKDLFVLENELTGKLTLFNFKNDYLKENRNNILCTHFLVPKATHPDNILVVDSFNRADSPSLGSTENGLIYQFTGTGFKIENNKIRPNSNGNRTYVDTLNSNYSIETVFNSTLGIQQWLIFRLSSPTNYVRLGITSAKEKNSNITYQIITNGSIAYSSPIIGSFNSGDKIRLDCYGSIISLYVNNKLSYISHIPILNGSGVGFQANIGETTSFDYLIITK